MKSFPGSVLLESAMCGSIDTSEDDHGHSAAGSDRERIWKRFDKFGGGLCAGEKAFHQSEDFDEDTTAGAREVGGDVRGSGGDYSISTDGETSASRGNNRRRHDDDDRQHHGRHARDQQSISEYSDEESSQQTNTTATSEQQQQQQQQQQPPNPTSALFARALVSEVTDNPKTMKPAAMADREKKLLKAQVAAKQKYRGVGPKPVGAPGGIGQANLLGSIAHALTGGSLRGGGSADAQLKPLPPSQSVLPPNSLQENRAQQQQQPHHTNANNMASTPSNAQSNGGKYSITIGLSLSRRHSTVGHPDTVTRQTAFDFNELQDRQYKYVSSTDSSGWRAGGGERGGNSGHMASEDADTLLDDFGSASLHPHGVPHDKNQTKSANSLTGTASMASQSYLTSGNNGNNAPQPFHKVAAPDTVHIPIIQIDAESPQAVDAIIGALASGEVFIPHMAVLPESLSVNGISPPDLVVRFGCERNDDVPPDEWPNWCLEFMHNQLYEYFQNLGARWTKRPFSITLARKVRWKTVKHMNRYFAHAERVIDAWREKGPQYLDPQLSYIEGGATPEEVARPHGIYLLRNGVPTNYFAPNFDPPYTTKMTRSLLLNVLGKSWDKKRREWTPEPLPRLVTPSILMATMCGCTDPGTGGFMANEVTHIGTSLGNSHISDQRLMTRDQHQTRAKQHPQQEKMIAGMGPASPTPMGVVSAGTPHSHGSSSTGQSRRRKKQAPPVDNKQSPVSSNFSNQEEKKVDDELNRRQGPAEAPGMYMTFPIHDSAPSAQQERDRPQSDFGRSVANSGTTVQHTNHLQGPAQVSAQELAASSSNWRKKKAASSSGHVHASQGLPTSDSSFSMNYSIDSGNLMTDSPASGHQQPRSAGVGGGSMMMQIAEANQTSMQRVSARQIVEQRQRQQQQQPKVTTVTNEEDISLQTSFSSNEVIPTDEELFAVGWAKAMDPNSGNYYYFTLDRTKTVWENPLSTDTVVSGESSYLSGSASSFKR